MRVSLRHLFGFTFLAALAMAALVARRSAAELRVELAKKQTRQIQLKSQLHIGKPFRHEALMQSLDEYQTLANMRRQAEQRVRERRELFGQLQRADVGTVSIIALPTLPCDPRESVSEFRISIPPERKVWLHAGVIERVAIVGQYPWSDPSSSKTTINALAAKTLVVNSPFSRTGPYETQLATGEHTLTIHRGKSDSGSLPIEVSLDGRVLVRSNYVRTKLVSAVDDISSFDVQKDFAAAAGLPLLFESEMSLIEVKGTEYVTHAFQLRLNDRADECLEFPRNE